MSKGGKGPVLTKQETTAKIKGNKHKAHQSKKNKTRYKTQFYKTRKNKIRKMKRTLRNQPTNAQLESAIKSWEMDVNRGLPSIASIRATGSLG